MRRETAAAAAKRALRATLPVMAGYLVLGVGFGVLLFTRGYGAVWSLASALFIYAGSMQYAQAELLARGASLLTVALVALSVNARHLFYGISMVDRYRHTGKFKPYLIFALTDETYSLVCGETDAPEDPRYFFFVSLFDQCYWVAGCTLGGLLGRVLPFSAEGIEFSLTALFVTVFVEQWLTARDRFFAVAGVACSVLCLLLFGPDNFLIPAMVLISASLTLYRSVKKRRTGNAAAKGERKE